MIPGKDKIVEDEIMQELREIRAEMADRFPNSEEYLTYWKEQEEKLKEKGWKFVDPRELKKTATK